MAQRVGARLPTPDWRRGAVTSGIELLCVLVFAASLWREDTVWRYLALRRGDALNDAWQWYRLVTPILIHFGWLHLGFNLVMWEALARPLERAGGSWRLLLLVLAVAVGSDLLQRQALAYYDVFGGLSGVVYGVVGCLGVLSRRADRPAGLFFPAGLLAVSVIFMLMGFAFNGIANLCHLGGLVVGALFGWLVTYPGRRAG